MLVKSKGIVLKTTKFGETSLVAKVYTREHGLLTFMVKGVRSKRSKGKAALMQPMMILDLVIYLRSNQNMKSLRDYQFSHVYTQVPYDILRSTIGMFMLEVVTKCVKEEETNEEMFDFLFHSFVSLDQVESISPNFHLLFLSNLLDYIGFQPQGKCTEETPYFDLYEGNFVSDISVAGRYLEKNEAANFALMLLSDVSDADSLELSGDERKTLLDRLLLYYEFHVEGFKTLKSLDILRTVLN